MKKILVATCVVCVLSAPVTAQTKADAQKLFEQYEAKQRDFDATVADLYCDTAVIDSTRFSPPGEQRATSVPAPRFKEFIAGAMTVAQAKGDYVAYSNVRFTEEPGGTRIHADRYSVLSTSTSSVSLLVGSCNGKLAIIEESSQFQP